MADISEGINVDGERLTNVRIADEKRKTKQMKRHLNSHNSESLQGVFKIHKGNTKYTTNYTDSEGIPVLEENIEKVTKFKYLKQTTHRNDTSKKKSMPIYKQHGTGLETTKKWIKMNNSPYHSKNRQWANVSYLQ